MKISCNVLKKHIKNSEKIDFYSIWDTFTIRTAEVENIDIKGKNFDGVVTAKIIECNPHPKSNKLSILKVDNGKEHLQIVCGAPNVKVGLVGALIQVGGHIDNIEICAKPLLGIDSFGMMCSGKELGISDEHSGIIELPTDTKLGVDLKEVLPIEDIIVEIDNKSLTNRPDLWGHYGIAREIAAITGNDLLPLELDETKIDKKDLKIKINNPELCYRYIGAKIEKIENTNTPMGMQIFLYYVGMRSINLIVDLTNYIMLELGQPMHAFDANIVDEIEIGLAKNDDKFTTLDGSVRLLTNHDLMIKNGGKYFAVAGVMGGLDSEITDNTNSIVLESASFEASTIRKTATSLGLRTEASSRYEKSLDPNLALDGTKRFIKLLKDENPNLEFGSNITDVYPKVFKEKEVILEKKLLYKYMNFEIEDSVVKNILNLLSFKVKVLKDSFKVIVPTFRATKDVTIAADLIEEITRLYGYENFKEVPLNMDLTFGNNETTYEQEYEVKEYLVNKYNFNEIHTYLWNQTSFLKNIDVNIDNVKLIGKNEDNILRNDLSLSMLEAAYNNTKRYENIKIFEIGTIIENDENKRSLSVLLSDDVDNLKNIYNEAKSITYNLIKALKNIKPIFKLSESKHYYYNELTQNIIFNNNIIGQIKVFNRSISNKINRKKCFVVIDIDFDYYSQIKKENIIYDEVSKYPAANLDYTIISKRGEYYKEFEKIIDNFTSPIIIKRELVDIYIENDIKKITIRYTVGSKEKTLTSEELKDFKEKFIKFIEDNELSIILE
ncbi:MAG: phenylalanine--tRNA ligase subunit beta [Bacilli bacterium]|nr:phenylalanine--tRNA ligase subunit beta [Bacilli bacterium]MDD4407093.1 phenylalanine--tRNA ligase subunit beta [Bacilli bacterium]